MDELTGSGARPGSRREPSRAHGARRANFAAALGTVWGVFGAPGSVLLTLFMKEYLHAEKWQIGLLVTMTCLGPVFEPAGAYLVERFGRRKLMFLGCYLLNRIPFFTLGLIPLLGPPESTGSLGIAVVLSVVGLTRVAAHLGTPAWWSWMADLIPERGRSRFFGCRNQAVSAATAISLMAGMLLLHMFGGLDNRPLASLLFTIGAVFGVADILLYFGVPEPAHKRDPSPRSRRELLGLCLEPYRHKRFRKLILGMGIWSFSSNLALPFLAVYQRGEVIDGRVVGLGISWIQLAGLNVLGSLAATMCSRMWADCLRKIGTAPILCLGSGHLFLTLVYVIADRQAGMYLLVPTAFLAGALQAAWILSTQQLMLSISPARNRSFFVSAYNSTNGCLMAWGPLLGGILADHCASMPRFFSWLENGTYFHLLVMLACIGGAIGLAALLRVPLEVAAWSWLPRKRVSRMLEITEKWAAARLST